MVDVIVRAVAVRWVDDAAPGWIEVSVRAAGGRIHRIIEKAPVLTALALTVDSKLPQELWLRGTSSFTNANTTDVTLAFHVTTTDGLQVLTMEMGDVVWL